MERKINKLIEQYITEYKNDIKNKAIELNVINDVNVKQLLQYIYDYERLILNKDHFIKRKRITNIINLNERCCAKRANNIQCSRKRKNDTNYCGTHIKGTPNGIIDENNIQQQNVEKIDIWTHDFNGILYYIDNYNNVYKMEDILSNNPNPEIIAKYVKNGDTYFIPEFNI